MTEVGCAPENRLFPPRTNEGTPLSPRPRANFSSSITASKLFIRTLFQQLASPAHLQPLRLVEVLDWTAATLNRIDAVEFFRRFNDAEAVQFFYEPFLEAFDPELRKVR
jgi:hypothetical protein